MRNNILKTGLFFLLLLGILIGKTSSIQAANPDCSLSGVIYCNDWEGGHPAIDQSAASCAFVDTARANSPTHSFVQNWAANQDSCGFYYFGLSGAGMKVKDFYIRWYQFMSAEWNCNDPAHESKDFIVYGSSEPSSDWGTGFQLQLGDGNFGKCGLGFRPIRTVVDRMYYQNQGKDVDFSVNPTKWYCIEAHVRVNDLSRSNGVIEAWVDNVMVMQYINLQLSPADDYFREVQGTGSKINVSSSAISRWTDDIVVGTQRIGCRGSVMSPPPPASDLKVQ